MKLAVIGATGMVGSRVADEALRRGHQVTAVSRRPAADPLPAPATAIAADAGDREVMLPILSGVDAAVVSVRGPDLEEVTEALLETAAATRARLLIVGGAGPLWSPHHPGRLVLDDPAHVAPEWRDAAAASTAQLHLCRRHPEAYWTYLSPPALLEPGDRTSTYRRGGDMLLTAPDGSSRISAEDFAIAILDELERPGAGGHFTVGY